MDRGHVLLASLLAYGRLESFDLPSVSADLGLQFHALFHFRDRLIEFAANEICFGQGVNVRRVFRGEFDGSFGMGDRLVKFAVALGGQPGDLVLFVGEFGKRAQIVCCVANADLNISSASACRCCLSRSPTRSIGSWMSVGSICWQILISPRAPSQSAGGQQGPGMRSPGGSGQVQIHRLIAKRIPAAQKIDHRSLPAGGRQGELAAIAGPLSGHAQGDIA